MARELAPHQRAVPPAHVDLDFLQRMMIDHMSRMEHMIKKMQRDIPVIVDEYLYMQNATSLILQPQSQNLELITGILAIVTSAGGGTLLLGRRIIPLPQGNTFLSVGVDKEGGGMLLINTDLRQITQNNAGILALEMFGVELPDKGAF
jgi:hypothetical protein